MSVHPNHPDRYQALCDQSQHKPDRRGVRSVWLWASMAVIAIIALVSAVPSCINLMRGTGHPHRAEENLRDLTIGMFNWHSMLDDAERDRVEQSGLSWRVHVLPYAGMQHVYDQFHLDEPWNSPHNRDFLKMAMPLFWSPDGALDIEEGKTCFLAACRPGESFDATKVDFSTTKPATIVLVEVDDEHAVPWTKPGDWEIDPANPTHGLRVKDGSFLAGFSDGKVRRVPADTSADELRRMFGLDEPRQAEGRSRIPQILP